MFRFDPEKALEAILYVASKAKADKYGTLKILYLADKCHLERYGRFISGDYYHALREGATPMLSYDIIEFAARSKQRCRIDSAREALRVGRKDNQHALTPLREPDLDRLSDSDIECLDEIIDGLKNVEPDQYWKAVREDVHDKAWAETWKKNRNGEIDIESIAAQFPNSEELIDYLRHA